MIFDHMITRHSCCKALFAGWNPPSTWWFSPRGYCCITINGLPRGGRTLYGYPGDDWLDVPWLYGMKMMNDGDWWLMIDDDWWWWWWWFQLGGSSSSKIWVILVSLEGVSDNYTVPTFNYMIGGRHNAAPEVVRNTSSDRIFSSVGPFRLCKELRNMFPRKIICHWSRKNPLPKSLPRKK